MTGRLRRRCGIEGGALGDPWEDMVRLSFMETWSD
jgi:hypothetical protein